MPGDLGDLGAAVRVASALVLDRRKEKDIAWILRAAGPSQREQVLAQERTVRRIYIYQR